MAMRGPECDQEPAMLATPVHGVLTVAPGQAYPLDYINELIIWKLNPFVVPNNAFISEMFESKFDCWLDHVSKGCSLDGKSKIETYFNMASMVGNVSWEKTML